MPYGIRHSQEEGLILLTLSSQSPRVVHEEARSEVAKLCAETGCSRVLVDLTSGETIMSGSTLDLFQFGKDFSEGAFPSGVRIAAVNTSVPKPDLEFLVTVAKNRGISMELFADAEEARQWLFQSAPGEQGWPEVESPNAS